MNVTDFNSQLTREEAGKEQVSIAQTSEIISRANKMLGGWLYRLIRLKRNPAPKKKPSGFGLVEFMIVVAILGLLAGITIPGFLKAREEARKLNHAPVAVIEVRKVA